VALSPALFLILPWLSAAAARRCGRQRLCRPCSTCLSLLLSPSQVVSSLPQLAAAVCTRYRGTPMPLHCATQHVRLHTRSLNPCEPPRTTQTFTHSRPTPKYRATRRRASRLVLPRGDAPVVLVSLQAACTRPLAWVAEVRADCRPPLTVAWFTGCANASVVSTPRPPPPLSLYRTSAPPLVPCMPSGGMYPPSGMGSGGT
jgi:hypothetical protein